MVEYIVPFFGGIVLMIVSLVIIIKHDLLDKKGRALMTKKRTWISFIIGVALILFSVIDFILSK